MKRGSFEPRGQASGVRPDDYHARTSTSFPTDDRSERLLLSKLIESSQDVVSTRPRLGETSIQTQVEDSRWIDRWHGSTLTHLSSRIDMSSSDRERIGLFLQRVANETEGRDLARRINAVYSPHPHQMDLDAMTTYNHYDDDLTKELTSGYDGNFESVQSTRVSEQEEPKAFPWPEQSAVDPEGLEHLKRAIEELNGMNAESKYLNECDNTNEISPTGSASKQSRSVAWVPASSVVTTASMSPWTAKRQIRKNDRAKDRPKEFGPPPGSESSSRSLNNITLQNAPVNTTEMYRGTQCKTNVLSAVKDSTLKGSIQNCSLDNSTSEIEGWVDVKNRVLRSAAERFQNIKTLLSLVESASQSSVSNEPRKISLSVQENKNTDGGKHISEAIPHQSIERRPAHEVRFSGRPQSQTNSTPIHQPMMEVKDQTEESSEDISKLYQQELFTYMANLGLVESEKNSVDRSLNMVNVVNDETKSLIGAATRTEHHAHCGMKGLEAKGRAWSAGSKKPPPIQDSKSQSKDAQQHESEKRKIRPSTATPSKKPQLYCAPTPRTAAEQIVQDFGIVQSSEKLVNFARRARENSRQEEAQREALEGAVAMRGKRRNQKLKSLKDASDLLFTLSGDATGATNYSLRAGTADVHVPKWVIQEAKRRAEIKAEKEVMEEKRLRARMELEQARARRARARILSRLKAKHQGELASRSLGIGAVPGQGGAACSTAKLLAQERAKGKRIAELRKRRADLARWQEQRRSLLLDEQLIGDMAVFNRLSSLRECDVAVARQRILEHETKHQNAGARKLTSNTDEVADLPIFKKLFGSTEKERRSMAPIIEDQKRILESAVDRADISSESRLLVKEKISSDEWYKGPPMRFEHSPAKAVKGSSLYFPEKQAQDLRWKTPSSCFSKEEPTERSLKGYK